MPLQLLIPLKKYPFVRLFTALAAGIISQWYLQFSLLLLLFSAVPCCMALALFYALPVQKRYTLRWLQGIFTIVILAQVGAILTYEKDPRHKQNWFGKSGQTSSTMLVSIAEKPEEKLKSYKAVGSVDAALRNGQWIKTSGKILLYFDKSSFSPTISYGTQIVVNKPFQQIRNTGNPGAFDYNR